MSSFDAARKLSMNYPNEKQRNFALDIMRPPGLSSQVKFYGLKFVTRIVL